VTPHALPAALAVLLLAPALAGAENEVALYLGFALAPRSDLHLEGAGDSVTYHGVSWRTESFEGPLYYGVRLTHWREGHPQAGVALDFTHAKVYLKDTNVRVTGTRGGTPVDQAEATSATIGSFSNSHGLNFLTVNALVRGGAPDPGEGPEAGRRVRPYAGLGAGVALPHVEAVIGADRTNEYQYAGPAVQALAGVAARVGDRWGAFGEYKFDRAWLHEDLSGGRTARLNVDVHQVVGGVSRGF